VLADRGLSRTRRFESPRVVLLLIGALAVLPACGATDSGDEGGVVDLRAMGVITLPSWSHPLWADAEGVLVVRTEPALGVAFVEWYPYVEG
jgi:hypothetical protein